MGVGIVVDAQAVPPSADGFDGERSGVGVGAHVHPTGVAGDVVDALGCHLPELFVLEVMDVHPRWRADR
jgi:hypothetical protein